MIKDAVSFKIDFLTTFLKKRNLEKAAKFGIKKLLMQS